MNPKNDLNTSQKADTNQQEIVCSNCSAKLKFAPGTTMLACEYCGTENEIVTTTANVKEIDFEKYLGDMMNQAEQQEVLTVSCNACGAETTLDEKIISDSCPFCGNHLVVSQGSSGKAIKPKSLLPFGVDEKKAHELFRKWINGLWWAPGALKMYAQQSEKLAGIYIPHWTYDSDTFSHYTGQRGTDYTTTESYKNDKGETAQRQVTKTSWTTVSGTITKFFNDVLVVASNSLPKKYMVRLEPWDLNNLVDYDPKFLSGFRAESYHVNLKEGFDAAKDSMKDEINKLVMKDIGGDHQRVLSVGTAHRKVTFKHILLPVWISAFRYNAKPYRFMVNARTGEVQGERPYSAGKIILAVVVGLVIIGGIVWAYNHFSK